MPRESVKAPQRHQVEIPSRTTIPADCIDLPVELQYGDQFGAVTDPYLLPGGDQVGPTPQTPVSTGTPTEQTVQVGWSKDNEYVQVGVQYASPDGHEGQSLWCDLDRAGINRLIRLLRKARDQAYGTDA